MVRLQFRRSEECRILLYCYYSQVHTDPSSRTYRCPIYKSKRSVKNICIRIQISGNLVSIHVDLNSVALCSFSTFFKISGNLVLIPSVSSNVIISSLLKNIFQIPCNLPFIIIDLITNLVPSRICEMVKLGSLS